MDISQTDGLTIWIAAYRMHTEFHNVTDVMGAVTDCGRSTVHGMIATRADLEAKWARPCPRCWPTDPNAVGGGGNV